MLCYCNMSLIRSFVSLPHLSNECQIPFQNDQSMESQHRVDNKLIYDDFCVCESEQRTSQICSVNSVDDSLDVIWWILKEYRYPPWFIEGNMTEKYQLFWRSTVCKMYCRSSFVTVELMWSSESNSHTLAFCLRDQSRYLIG